MRFKGTDGTERISHFLLEKRVHDESYLVDKMSISGRNLQELIEENALYMVDYGEVMQSYTDEGRSINVHGHAIPLTSNIDMSREHQQLPKPFLLLEWTKVCEVRFQ